MAHGQGTDHGHAERPDVKGSLLISVEKRVALLISVLTLCLALSETLGTSAQTSAISYNVEAADIWSFYQAKSIRMTAVRSAADALQLDLLATSDPAARQRMQERIDTWLQDAARYESEPDKQEGRKELEVRAKEEEDKRDEALASYHDYEIASAVLQIGIVLASASVITGMIVLTWIAGALGVVGLLFMALGLVAPHAGHFL